MRKKSLSKMGFGVVIVALAIFAVTFWGKSGGDGLSDNTGKMMAIPIDTTGMNRVIYSEASFTDDSSFKKAASSQVLDLYYRESDGTIEVKDRRNGYNWMSSADIRKLDNSNEINDMWKQKISSLFNIKYFDLLKDKGVPVETNALDSNALISIKKISNGIDIRYVFEKIQMEIHIEIALDDDRMTVKIPYAGIRENSTYKLASIEILPAFGAAGPKDSGYVFYPDGCGAISKYDTKRISTRMSQYRWPIYGNDIADIDLEAQTTQKGIKTAMLPVFGIKNGQNACIALISQGAADSTIIYSPSGVGINMYRIYTEAIYRRLIDESILGSSNVKEQNEEKIQKFQSEIQKKDIIVNYFFLYGKDADYSGMANKCRTYLEQNGLIRKSAILEKGMPLAIDLFMGINKKTAFLDKYISLTDFKQARYILENISGIFDGKLIVSLTGWAENGYDRYPTLAAADDRIGGNTGLTQLTSYIGGKSWDIFLNADLMDYDKRNGGFSLNKDVIYYGNTLQVTDKTNNLYLLNVSKFLDKYMKRYQDFALERGAGLALDKYGKYLYSDFNDKYTRDQTAEKITDGIAELEKKALKIAGEGNLYMLKSASYLINIPQSDSEYDITDEAVPFYQMVVHGLIPYTSESGNLASDYRWQKLKWVEYGCIPYYMLTHDSADELKNTSYNSLFSSSYQNWLAAIDGTVREYSDIADLWKYRIIRHEMLTEGVYGIIYENGEKVYVNYNSQPVQVENVMVGGMNFRVCK